MPQAIEITVELPDRAARARAASTGRKPMAEVTVVLEGNDARSIVVPVRVGRVLRDTDAPLPCDVDDAFDYIHALEGRICFTLLVEMLSRRDHSIQEARDKLARYGYRDQEIEAAIERARKSRYLDDGRFATQFIEQRIRQGWGRRKIEQELRHRGIETDAIPGYPEAFFSEEDDRERALELLRHRSIPSERTFEKLTRSLMSKGFPYAIAADAARARIDEAS